MDAKPTRLRAASRIRDENAPPTNMAQMKTLQHNRTKSTPALSSLLKQPVKTTINNGINGFGRQRTAFADVSNTFRSTANHSTVKDDLSIHKDGYVKPTITLQPLMEVHDTSTYQMNKQPALLRPAQRPLSAVMPKQASVLQPTVTASAVPKQVAQESGEYRSSDPEQLLRFLNRKRTTIFREQSTPVEQEGVALTKEPVRQVASFAPVHQVLEPRREKELPSLPEPVLPAFSPVYEERDAYEQEVKDFSRDLIQSIEQTFAKAEETVVAQEEVEVVHALPALPSRTSSSETIPSAEPVYQPTDEEIYQLALETQLPPLDPALANVNSAGRDYPEYFDEDDEEYYDAEGYTTARSIRSRGDNTTGALTTFLEPRITQRVMKELEQARDFVLANRTEEDIEDEAWDTSMVAEYGDDIFEYMHTLESKMRPNEHYMDNQNEIQWSMRSVLMDWMIQVHGRFGLLPETLFLAVNYIDRFLSCKVVSLGKLQLVGATALFVAAKYEEINCPSVQEIVYMVDNAYTVDEILKAERFMLSMLQFELGWPGPMSFLRRISKADEYDLDTRTMAKYFLEVMIMDERFVACPPSFASAAAHCLSRLVLDKGDWTMSHTHYSQYTYWQLYDIVAKLVQCCQDPRKHHQAVFEKYQEKKYKRCALTAETMLTSGIFKLPSKNSGRESSASGNWQMWKRF